MKKWLVVYTQAGKEDRARSNLERQGYEVYLPHYSRRRVHARRVEFVDRPLFPRYLFVSINLSKDIWRPILGTFGVCDLIRTGDHPNVLPEGLVDLIRAQETIGRHDERNQIHDLKLGAAVRVVSGPFVDLVGRLRSLHDSQRVSILLELLGREVSVRVPMRALAPI